MINLVIIIINQQICSQTSTATIFKRGLIQDHFIFVAGHMMGGDERKRNSPEVEVPYQKG